MNMKRALVFAAAVLASRAAPAVAGTEVDWIGKLPGLSLQTSKTTASAGFKAIYRLSAEVDATMDSVRSGLTERGWTIRKEADTPVGGLEVRTLTADKDGARVKVSVSNAVGVGTVTVSLQSGAAAGPERSRSSSRSSGSVDDIVRGALEGAGMGSAGGGLVLIQNGVTETHDCNGGDVSVNGNRSEITLGGECGTVKVLGNSNTVTVEATVQAIYAVGRSNTVVWSAQKNPRAPAVSNVGSQNRVHSDAQR